MFSRGSCCDWVACRSRSAGAAVSLTPRSGGGVPNVGVRKMENVEERFQFEALKKATSCHMFSHKSQTVEVEMVVTPVTPLCHASGGHVLSGRRYESHVFYRYPQTKCHSAIIGSISRRRVSSSWGRGTAFLGIGFRSGIECRR